MHGRHEQVDVPEHAAARFVQHQLAQAVVRGNESRLLPDSCPGRRFDTADDDVADFAFGMAADDFDFRAPGHEPAFCRKTAIESAGITTSSVPGSNSAALQNRSL